MDDDDLEAAISDWVVDHPEAIPVLERWGIDYCCGGKSLEYACLQRNVDPYRVLREVRRLASRSDDFADGSE